MSSFIPNPTAQAQTSASTEATRQAPTLPTAAEVQERAEDVSEAAVQAASVITAEPDTASQRSGAFSNYSSDAESRASTSLASSVRDYAFENGRRYHRFREGAYLFPNDEPEQDREDMKHAMAVSVMGDKLHFAPIENPQQVIDLGTGTGIWAIEFADSYPSANVLGIDLSPIQPSWVPPNCRFVVDDAESEWLHPKDYFDFVHARHTAQAFKNYDMVLKRAYNHIKPGGWMECQEMHHFAQCDDGSMPDDYKLTEYIGYIQKGLAVLGPDLQAALKLADKLKATGFVNVEERVLKVPIGTWARNQTLKKIGLYFQAVLMDGLQGIALGPMCRGLGWSPEEVEVFLPSVREDLKNKSIHSYFTLHVIYGQKPA
ncbi:hypothetical protein H2201_007434 [Coniosporium apollinis]|uniref:Methyltransferase n=2 Tax=Coniosporium TaxID=2810619 RepID=A0ABQ9NNA8_9PEZI|nr:hypothetical protein H2199_006825 [Cladosporium sp. JES 115]KAJ9659284.1 hypothetical protein H2201_007434 [Coniosporium apollinis]